MKQYLILCPAFLAMSCTGVDEVSTRPALLEPDETIIAENGKAELPDGTVVEFIGAYDFVLNTLKPWGLDGKPLDEEKQRWFWDAIEVDQADEDKIKRLREEDRGRTFAVAFAVHGNDVINIPIEDEETLYDMYIQNRGHPNPEQGIKHAPRGYVMKPLTGGPTLNMRFRIDYGKWETVFVFSEDERELPSGYRFNIEKQRNLMFGITREERQEIPLIMYMITVRIPNSPQGIEYRLITNDPEPPQEGEHLAIAMHESIGIRGASLPHLDLDDYIFMIQVRDLPDFNRTFTLQRRPQRFVEFRGIPLRPDDDSITKR